MSKFNFKFNFRNFFFVFFNWIAAFLLIYVLRFYKFDTTYIVLQGIEFNYYLPLISIALMSFIFGLANSIFETVFNQYIGKKLSFGLLVVIKTLHIILWLNTSIVIIFIFNETLLSNDKILYNLKDFYFSGAFLVMTIYALSVSSLINILMQVNIYFGKGGLLKLITGKYHQPKKEERIFMFLDMKSSIALAENLGDINYSRFLKQFFLDISDPIEKSNGEIFQYVGDEVVVTWLPKRNSDYDYPIKCFFDILATIDRKKGHYYKHFGVLPEFKAAIHSGMVVTTTVGYYKTDIVHHGDAINTASRIQEKCNELNSKLLISEELSNKVENKDHLFINDLGKFLLKGKKKEVRLYSVEEIRREII